MLLHHTRQRRWLAAAATMFLGAACGVSAAPRPGHRGVHPTAPVLAKMPAQTPGAAATHGQAITLEAGTGVLVPLPQPATTILSAEPSIARVQPASPTSLFLMGVGVGHTTIVATSESGLPIIQYDVTVTGASGGRPGSASLPRGPLSGADGGDARSGAISASTIAAIEKSIHRLVPGASGVHASAAGGRVVLSGSVRDPAAGQQAEAIARGYAGEAAVVVADFAVLSSIQVNVRVRIAEMSRTIERQLGFNWQALGANGKWRFGALTGAGAAPNSTISGLTTGVAGLSSATVSGLPFAALDPRLPLGLTGNPNQIGAGFRSGGWDINGIIDALATDQLVTILAEPNLTAQSGEPASFLAGGEFPIPVAGNTSNGATTITVEFKQYGVSLQVVPTVLSPGRINLRVRPEVSQLSTTGAVSVPIAGGTLTIPALTVRRAETTVELGSGQSFAIAGLLQKSTTDLTNAVPGVGELPVIGALFKSNDFQRGESELVIIVTPYLVKPAANPASLQVPTTGFRPATDLDRILLGRQVSQPSGAPLDAGFILK
jgi:pilus assembly protein CpaC